jgi:hypothetical protein
MTCMASMVETTSVRQEIRIFPNGAVVPVRGAPGQAAGLTAAPGQGEGAR